MRDELVPPRERLSDRVGDRLRVAGIGADGRVAARLVQRLVRGRRHRDAARHRLEHGNPEALEARRVDEDRRAAVEARELAIVDVAEPDHAGPVEPRLRAPARRADDRERKLSVEQLVRGEQRLEVLPRLERRDGQRVRPPEVGALALAREDRRRSRMRDAYALRLDVQQLAHVTRSELRVAHEDVGRPRRVPVLRAVHAHRPPVRPVGEAQRNEIVDRRRADATALRREHPVREVQHVEPAEPALRRWPCDARPRGSPAVRERQDEQPALDIDPRQRLLDVPAAFGRDGREGDHVGAVLTQAAQRREHVVADSRARVRERRDVERDPRRCVYANVRKRMPSRRPPATFVGETTNRAAQFRSGTVRPARTPGKTTRVAPFAVTICGRWNRLGSPSRSTRDRAAAHSLRR